MVAVKKYCLVTLFDTLQSLVISDSYTLSAPLRAPLQQESLSGVDADNE
jgi:hypothetical protein